MNYAHSIENYPSEDWQPLSQHLLAVASLARNFADALGLRDDTVENEAFLAGLLHDLGKYRPAFQKRLHGGPATLHAIYGAAYAFESGQVGTTFAIAGHHAGLHDLANLQDAICMAKNELDPVSLVVLLEKELSATLPNFPGAPAHIDCLDNDETAAALSTEFYTRILFSCIVDADRLDSAFWAKPGVNTTDLCKIGAPLDAVALLDLVETARNRKRATAPDDDLSHARNLIFDACVTSGAQVPGFFSLTVPTGGGKTLSAMAFALAHAKKNELRRIIVVIPYLSIIEQNATEYRSILDPENKGIVLEHHSSVKPRINASHEECEHLELVTENWDAPIIITTSVQFIESLFAASPSRARKLHNIARSVVIFDEVQTLPSHLLSPVLNVFRELSKNYGVSFVFSSATQPAFRKSVSLPEGFRDEELYEIAPDPKHLFKTLCRVEYRFDPPETRRDWETLAGELAAVPQCLCVVNLTRHARELWEVLKNHVNDGTVPIHLSSAMCPAHRFALIRCIRKRLKAGRPCRVVSTQLIEAGVDVDFPTVWRSMGPLDSIVQVAGRCNREGKLKDAVSGQAIPGIVHIFTPADNKLPTGIYNTATNQAAITLSSFGGNAAETLAVNPDIFRDYFTSLYSLSDTDYTRRGEATIQEERANLHFRKTAQKAKVIEDDGQPVIIPKGKARRIIAAIRDRKPVAGEPRFGREDLRRLQRYMVNVRQYYFSMLERYTLIEPLLPNLDLFVLKDGVYHSSLGLLLNDRPMEDYFL